MPTCVSAMVKAAILSFAVQGVASAQGFSNMVLIPPASYAIEDAPFTANIESIRIETLANQTHITHRILSRTMRDSAGRQRFEQGKDEAFYPSPSPPDVRIYDVVLRTIFHLDQVKATAFSDPMGPTQTAPLTVPASKKPVVWQMDNRAPETSVKERLPTQQIAGLAAEGTRTTYTIAAGSEGNDTDLQVIDEAWISPLYRMQLMHVHDDPRHGREVVQVTQFIAGEPDASLFQVPDGYKVLDRRSGAAVVPAQSSAGAGSGTTAVNHSAKFEEERKQANELFLAGKVLEALPLYEDLCRQDQTVAVFAERHAAGLFAKQATLSNDAEKKAVQEQGMAELRRAQSLGDNSSFVQSILALQAKNTVGSILSGVPLTVGYTYHGKPDAQAAMKEAETAFARNDMAAAVEFYKRASALDPSWYDPALYAGDTYFRLKDISNAGLWFQKAIVLDPDRETAYRYWGDALAHSGDLENSKKKFEQAVVAEPYGKNSWLALGQWAKLAHAQVFRPQIVRPEFTTPGGKLQADPTLAQESGDGRASWQVYQKVRVAYGASGLNQIIVAGGTDANGIIHPSGYRHSLAEESESLTAMLSDVQAKLKAGTVMVDKLDPSIKNLLQLQNAGMIDCWVIMNAADTGIRADYPAYRKDHRELLLTFIDRYMVREAPAAQ
jgi:tetratricopeptide (TPR) repeat protein